ASDHPRLAARSMRRVRDAETARGALLASFATGVDPVCARLLRGLLVQPRRDSEDRRLSGVFVFLPLVLPLTAWPIARLAEQHLHPRTATRMLTGVAAVMAVCSTVCLALVMVVGTAQLPGNPLPDGWSDPEVRAAVPYDEVV